MTEPSPVRLVSKRNVAARLDVSERTIERLVERGEFPQPVRLSANRISWRSDEIDRFIDSREVA